VSVSIRPYEAKDLEPCRALWAELVQHHRELYNDATLGGDNPGLEFDRHIARDDLAAFWVADQEGEVAGMTGLLFWGREAEIEPVVVARNVRGTGIGKLLIARALDEARSRGARFLSLRPVVRNRDALRLFMRQGFTKAGQVELSMDLGGEPPYDWRRGIELHGHPLEY
jgi:N-acetylglutamate synthase-like GNAT family acetyltransferase